MLFGHNTNVVVDGTDYHVQTEDRGAANPLIDTTVHCRGRVMHRRANNYFDLLPLDDARITELKHRLDHQHRAVVEEIRSGALNFVPPPVPGTQPPHAPTQRPAPAQATQPAAPPQLVLEVVNPRGWLKGRQATLHIAVNHGTGGEAVAFAKVKVRVEGAASAAEFHGETGLHGRAEISFEMPKLESAEPAIVIEASEGAARGHLRFHLKAKPRVPAV